MFLILINALGYPDLETNLGERITEKLGKRAPLPNIHMKYVDDLSLAQAINLKECLKTNPDPNPPRPLVKYSQDNQMVVNENKCKVMIFNNARNYDATPQLTLSDTGVGCLEVVETFKLLGVIIRSDLRWCDNTNYYLCKKGFSRLWLIRRLKVLGASKSETLDVYIKQVRSILELL